MSKLPNQAMRALMATLDPTPNPGPLPTTSEETAAYLGVMRKVYSPPPPGVELEPERMYLWAGLTRDGDGDEALILVSAMAFGHTRTQHPAANAAHPGTWEAVACMVAQAAGIAGEDLEISEHHVTLVWTPKTPEDRARVLTELQRRLSPQPAPLGGQRAHRGGDGAPEAGAGDPLADVWRFVPPPPRGDLH